MMMSHDVEELEIQNQVEIESDSVDLQCETVESLDLDGRPIVSLQHLHDRGDELILETTEEVVGCGDDLAYEEIPLESDMNYIDAMPGPSRTKIKKGNRRVAQKFRGHEMLDDNRPQKKWEQKRVQIKTLEGEFSVTMWASGTDDGKLIKLDDFTGVSVRNGWQDFGLVWSKMASVSIDSRPNLSCRHFRVT